MFETIIQGQNTERTGRKRTVLVSFVAHILVLGVLIVIPLIYYQTIPGGWEFVSDVFAGTLPTPPPPSPPPQTQPRQATGTRIPTDRPVILLSDKLIEPPLVPAPEGAVEIPLSNVLTGDGPVGLPGGTIPEGLPNGTIISNLIGTAGPKTPPPPPPKPQKAPMLISTLDPSRVIYRVEPVYPPMAIAARVQGAVLLRVRVSEVGTVESIEVVSGNPLLRQAAVDAVSQWRYKPTILNGEPVPVIATVTVNFNFRR